LITQFGYVFIIGINSGGRTVVMKIIQLLRFLMLTLY